MFLNRLVGIIPMSCNKQWAAFNIEEALQSFIIINIQTYIHFFSVKDPYITMILKICYIFISYCHIKSQNIWLFKSPSQAKTAPVPTLSEWALETIQADRGLFSLDPLRKFWVSIWIEQFMILNNANSPPNLSFIRRLSF